MKQFLVFILVLAILHVRAQLQVDTTLSPDTLVDRILAGKGIRVGNIKCNTDKKAIGYYTCIDNKIGIRNGLLLSSGYASGAVGPNNSPGHTGIIKNQVKRFKGDKDLNRLSKGGQTMDNSVIEFDFVPMENKVSFEYSFGSEEYTDYVGSQFNDVFGFFVTGPGLYRKNVALLPSDRKAVAINNVNHKTNKMLFINNDPFVSKSLYKNVSWKPKVSFWKKLRSAIFGTSTAQGGSVLYVTDKLKKTWLDETVFKTFQYDGFTKKMKVIFYVTPYAKYHIKMAVGDVGDRAFDSGVFIEGRSFIAVKDTSQPKFVDYADKRSTVDFDSIFGYSKKAPVSPVKQEEEEEEDLFEKTIVYFDSDSYEIPDSCTKRLDSLAALLRRSDFKLCLSGFADSTGNDSKNRSLSEKRAISVMNYLAGNGVDKSRLKYLGLSSGKPVSDNRTSEGRARNRRVEIDLVEEE